MLKHLVKVCHSKGIAVIVDVVINHLGPSDIDVWQFDGWQSGGGGIYFFQ
jgi:1,4-alpha-glucan branching enzyme